MCDLLNLDSESLASDLSQLLGSQNKETNQSIRIAGEEKLFTFDAKENEVSKETIAFITQIKIEENPVAYHCDKCYEEFQKESELNTHDCLRILQEQPLLTGIGFSDESRNKIDLKLEKEDQWEVISGESESKKHDGEEDPPAGVCDQNGLKEEPETETHPRSPEKGGSHYCGSCGGKFASVSDLKRHLLTHADKRYACGVCSKSFSQRHLLRRHALRHTKDDANKPFDCTVCGRKFTDEYSMKIHHIGHTVESLVCDVCKREFSKKQHLARHLYRHIGERPFVCEVCCKGFYRPSELKNHALTHDEEKQMRCEFCARAFHRKKYLMIHLRNHTGDKPFICSDCGKGFSQASDLRIHSYVHTEERPFACDVCGKGFYKKSFLAHHRRTHEKMPDVTGDDPEAKGSRVEEKITAGRKPRKTISSKRKRFLCEFCKRGFVALSRLKAHLREHSEKTPALAKQSRTRCVRKEAPLDPIVDVTFTRKAGRSVSEGTPVDPRATEKADRFVPAERVDEAIPDDEDPLATEECITSAPALKNSRAAGSGKSASQKLSKNSSQLRPKAGTPVGEEIHSGGYKNGKGIGLGSFPCHKCSKVYFHNRSLKRHLQKHRVETTGVNLRPSQLRPNSETPGGDCPVGGEIHSRRYKDAPKRKRKKIGVGSFACHKCNRRYFHNRSLKLHLQKHRVEITGVNLRPSVQKVKAPTESLEEKVHLFAPFKHFV